MKPTGDEVKGSAEVASHTYCREALKPVHDLGTLSFYVEA